MKCEGCEEDLVDVQAKMAFRALSTGQDWSEFPILATICPKCGNMELHVAVPTQFALWVTGNSVRSSL